MASGVDNNFGQELLITVHKEDISKPEHFCVVYVHWTLLQNGFKCIGIGDDKEVSGKEGSSEILPKGWNEGPNYLIRYLHNGKLFILRINVMGSDAIISLIRASDMKITSLAYPLGEYESADWNKLTIEVKKEVIKPLGVGEEAKPKSEILPKLREPPPYHSPPRSPLRPFGMFEPDPEFGGVGVGRTDLDPLGRFGPGGPSGMLFRPGRGGSYPGVRYDPILPGLGPRGNPPGPDPDHFRPPDFPPNYFM